MKRMFLCLALLFATSLRAQQATQVVRQPLAGPFASYTLTVNVSAPCMLVLATRGNAQTVTDSNNDTWANSVNSGLWYTTSCAGGAVTVTASGSAPFYFQAVLAGYPGQWTFDQVTTNANGAGEL
jgi:hypothetical protein